MKSLKVGLFALFLALSPVAVFAAPVDINTADAQALDKALKGVGPKTAAAIVAYRGKHGPFKSVDDLVKVKGIGPALLEKNRANMTVGAAAAQASSAGTPAAPKAVQTK